MIAAAPAMYAVIAACLSESGYEGVSTAMVAIVDQAMKADQPVPFGVVGAAISRELESSR